ncbi:ABC-type transport system periplasmic substrate-binding protein [Natrialba magadii ATCC 43099]|uniref:ABC-type transport system periplasmic substrate-binding protein n=1 Tax=Natrialba magadii (strain ATCC 43099 / DSM 3394 / CCM 3739 / CIP 104546 / IAM 13178 / JCM 8861 / NBRC 102185 / NCIMB 2190 / MS3) TaxID=547559 RepID=D3SWR7_NATMM|nr:ABC transporter substrate-binding protein [Natrialba magadii]ADD05799.1 ABC-type transport system periplasmic substrate-binding protein [Natrialba magadii ATCC 43099]ELY30125.1 family 1 extracellular solute-binding protein [Natrialba magadii ATCC 43099]
MGDDTMNVDRRGVLRGVGGGAIVLAGLGGAGSVSAQDAITVTAVWTDDEEEDFLAVVDYVEDETDIDISYAPRDTETLLTETLMDYEAGIATADIVVLPTEGRVRRDGEAGHLEPVGDLWDEDEYSTEHAVVEANGEVYAAPFGMDLKPGFWYRQSFFDEHGLEEPEDYDAFLDLLDEIDGIEGVEAPLASGNGDGWPLSDVTEAFILRQDDGAQLQQDLIEGDAEFTDDRVVTAFEELQELLQAGYFSEVRDFGVQYEFFWENETPLYFMGSWTPAFGAIEDPDDLEYFMLPGTDAMVTSINWFTIPAYTEATDAARTAVEEIISPDGQEVWTERGGFVPSSLEVPADAFDHDIMQELSEHADEVELVPDLDDAVGDPFQAEFWSQLLGLWAEPDQDVTGITESLDGVLQETVQEDDP